MQKTVVELYCRRPLISLQKMSLFRITTVLFNHPKLLKLILESKLQTDYFKRLYARKGPQWRAVQIMADEMVSQICNCAKLSEWMMELLWPVCYRIMVWKATYAPSIGNQFLRLFHWTDQGRIDSTRTAKCIIGNQNISIRIRFVLACSVCLGREIQEMWREMSNVDKMYFSGENNEKVRPLLLFWIHTMSGKGDAFAQFMNDACMCAAENGLLGAIKYLFAISAEDAREKTAYSCLEILVRKLFYQCYLEEDEINICYFLYFEMSDEHRGIMSVNSMLELMLLLHFSEREHFFNALEKISQNPSRDVTILLLYTMFINYHLEVDKDDDHRKSFVYIWRTIPTSMKNAIAKGHMGVEFLTDLIRDNFPFLLRKGASKKISDLTSSDPNSSTNITPFGFHRDKWEFLHFLIEEKTVTFPALKFYGRDMMMNLKIRKSNKAAWNRIVRFVRKIKSGNR